jgi:hypothetical protein
MVQPKVINQPKIKTVAKVRETYVKPKREVVRDFSVVMDDLNKVLFVLSSTQGLSINYAIFDPALPDYDYSDNPDCLTTYGEKIEELTEELTSFYDSKVEALGEAEDKINELTESNVSLEKSEAYLEELVEKENVYSLDYCRKNDMLSLISMNDTYIYADTLKDAEILSNLMKSL